jgi:hypothetical protein
MRTLLIVFWLFPVLLVTIPDHIYAGALWREQLGPAS